MSETSLESLGPDLLLRELEKRSDKLATQEKIAAESKGLLTALEASLAVTYRDSGMAVNEAEKRVRMSQEWANAYMYAQTQQIEFHKKKRDYERVVIAVDLWRSQQASLRKI